MARVKHKTSRWASDKTYRSLSRQAKEKKWLYDVLADYVAEHGDENDQFLIDQYRIFALYGPCVTVKFQFVNGLLRCEAVGR